MEDLRCHKQKRKRCARGRPLRTNSQQTAFERAALHIEARKQVVHWVCDTVIGVTHKGTVVTMIELKSGFSTMAKVKKRASEKKMSELVISATVDKLQPVAVRVKTLTFVNGKEFARLAHVDQ